MPLINNCRLKKIFFGICLTSNNFVCTIPNKMNMEYSGVSHPLRERQNIGDQLIRLSGNKLSENQGIRIENRSVYSCKFVVSKFSSYLKKQSQFVRERISVRSYFGGVYDKISLYGARKNKAN
jgi:hypothetical protein